MAYNLAGIRERVKAKLQNDALWSDAEVDDAINNGIDQLLLYISPTKEIWQENSSIGIREMNLPADVFFVYQVLYDGTELKKMTLDEHLKSGAESPAGVAKNGKPGKWYFREDDLNKYIGFDVGPESVKQVTVFVTRKFADLVADEDVPRIQRVLLEGAIHWAIQDLLEKDVVEEGSPNPTWRIMHHLNKFKAYRDEALAYVQANTRRKITRTRRR